MVISLIGMSGSGKTYWSKLLAQRGFVRFCCDDLIEELLGVELRRYGYRGIQDVAKWMGQPYQKQYARNSRKYLDLEREVMESIFTVLPSFRNHNVVIDTTGSVIYTGAAVMDCLQSHTKVVYFSTPLTVQQRMYVQYLADPKPVIWGDVFSRRFDESEREALARCYPMLLESRGFLYEQYAKVALDYPFIRNQGVGVDEFLEEIC